MAKFTNPEAFQFEAAGHGADVFVADGTMWRKDRRNGLKIAIFAISKLCAAYQILHSLPG